MKIDNETDLTLGWLVTSLQPGELAATFIVKGTFAVKPGEVAHSLSGDEAQFPTGDVFEADDPERCLVYPSDFAPYKARADVLLNASCHSPGGVPVADCPVSVRVGAWSKRLLVIGERVALPGAVGHAISDPAPFTRMRLSSEQAFGGLEHAANPLGKGAKPERLANGAQGYRLPNTQYVDDADLGSTGALRPAQLGAIPSTWAQRAAGGTYDEQWGEQRWPWFPQDFDWGHFNAAPPDQQLADYLHGDEEVSLENLHPAHGQFEFRLPSLRPQVFVENAAAGAWRAVVMRLDTLWLDPDAQRLVLVWRGHTVVQSLKLDDVAQVHLVSTSLDAPARTEAEHEAALMSKAEQVEQAQRRETAAVEAQRAEFAQSIAQMQAEFKGYEEQAEQRREDALRQLGVASTGAPVSVDEAFRTWNAGRAAAASTMEPSMAARLGLNRPLEVLDIPEEDAPWTRERCEAHAASGGSFSGLDLVELDLSGLELSNLDFSEANLSDCKFAGALLAGANLSGAIARGAQFEEVDLSGAVLADADFSGAKLRGANLTGVTADKASFRKADLSAARLDGAAASFADFSEADLSDAVLLGGSFERTDFSDTVLCGADFSLANLREALVENAQGAGVIMRGADLFQLHAGKAPDFANGDFQQASAPGSFWEGANLAGADFRLASLERADFSYASLTEARFDAADLRSASFEDADLEAARLAGANVFRGSFERAKLLRADLRQSNLYEAEFWDADTSGANLEHANLKNTKLA